MELFINKEYYLNKANENLPELFTENISIQHSAKSFNSKDCIGFGESLCWILFFRFRI